MVIPKIDVICDGDTITIDTTAEVAEIVRSLLYITGGGGYYRRIARQMSGALDQAGIFPRPSTIGGGLFTKSSHLVIKHMRRIL